MADYWTDFYRSVGIGAPEFTASPQMTPEEMYEGIYGEPLGGLSTRSAKSVPINPSTGMPYATTADAQVKYGAGIGAGASGSADYRKKVTIPGSGFGPEPVPKYQERLPALPAGLPLKDPGKSAQPVNMPHRIAGEPFNTFSDLNFKGSGPFKGDYDASMRFASGPQTAPKTIPKAAPDYRGYTASMRFASPSGSGVITLADEPASDLSGQNMADSLGKVVKTPGGKIYQPKQAPKVAPTTGGGLGGLGGGLGGLGALLGGLFGAGQGGQQQPQGGGLAGLLAGMNGGIPLAAMQTAPYGPGTTFEQRAAAANRRESLMNPPTETNWAAIEASAKNRR